MKKTLVLAHRCLVNFIPWKMSVSDKQQLKLRHTTKHIEEAIALIAGLHQTLIHEFKTRQDYYLYKTSIRHIRRNMQKVDIAAIEFFLSRIEEMPTYLISDEWIFLSIARYNFLSQWQEIRNLDFSQPEARNRGLELIERKDITISV